MGVAGRSYATSLLVINHRESETRAKMGSNFISCRSNSLHKSPIFFFEMAACPLRKNLYLILRTLGRFEGGLGTPADRSRHAAALTRLVISEMVGNHGLRNRHDMLTPPHTDCPERL